MDRRTPSRIAVLSLRFASHPFARPVQAADLPSPWIVEGPDFAHAARHGDHAVPSSVAAFFRAMDATGAWEPLPILAAEAGSGGPLDIALFDDLVRRVLAAFERLRPVDGLFISFCGPFHASGEADAAGHLTADLRARGGPALRIVANVDASANVSARFASRVDAIVGGGGTHAGERAALAFRLIAAGLLSPSVARVALPFRLPPLHAAARLRQRMNEHTVRCEHEQSGEVWSATLAGGAAEHSTDDGGICVLVTARQRPDAARLRAQEVAAAVATDFSTFEGRGTAIDEAIALAKADDGRRRLMLDLGDAIDAGGSGCSTEWLSALVWSGATDVVVACHCDPLIARQAHQAGLGATIRATFNGGPGSGAAGGDLEGYFEAEADVVGLTASLVGVDHPAPDAAPRACGPAAALAIGGVTVIVSTRRLIVRDDAIFTALGCDVTAARTAVLKGRYESLSTELRASLSHDVVDVATVGPTSWQFEEKAT